MSLDYSITKKLALSIYGSNTNSWTYDFAHKSNTFSLGQSLSYLVGKRISAVVGHENGGNTYGYNGKDLNIDFFNEDQSSFYSSINYSYNF